jgi:hypothetical protein
LTRDNLARVEDDDIDNDEEMPAKYVMGGDGD